MNNGTFRHYMFTEVQWAIILLKVTEASCGHTLIVDGRSTPSPDLLHLAAKREVKITIHEADDPAFTIRDERTTAWGKVLEMLNPGACKALSAINWPLKSAKRKKVDEPFGL
ncbi:hypothetical protein N7454_000502 [Penicillium verhagenii]|nr:hypothetical protein N7454_000502 [Penicillium verhagenii]